MVIFPPSPIAISSGWTGSRIWNYFMCMVAVCPQGLRKMFVDDDKCKNMKSNRMDSFIFYLYIDNFPFDSNKNLIYRLYRIRQKILHGYNMDIFGLWTIEFFFTASKQLLRFTPILWLMNSFDLLEFQSNFYYCLEMVVNEVPLFFSVERTDYEYD